MESEGQKRCCNLAQVNNSFNKERTLDSNTSETNSLSLFHTVQLECDVFENDKSMSDILEADCGLTVAILVPH